MVKQVVQAGLVILLIVTSSVAVYALDQIGQLQKAIAGINQQIAPKPGDAIC